MILFKDIKKYIQVLKKTYILHNKNLPKMFNRENVVNFFIFCS